VERVVDRHRQLKIALVAETMPYGFLRILRVLTSQNDTQMIVVT